MKILLLLDVHNLWTNARIMFGPKFRVDYGQLIKKSEATTVFAFVKEFPGKRNDTLIQKLTEAGATIAKYENVCDMAEVFRKNISNCDVFILGSGDILHKHLIAEANILNKKTVILSCAEGLSTELANEADKIQLITKKEVVKI